MTDCRLFHRRLGADSTNPRNLTYLSHDLSEEFRGASDRYFDLEREREREPKTSHRPTERLKEREK